MNWIILAVILIHVLIVFSQISKLWKKCYSDEKLADYIAGKLPDAESQSIANHVLTCESCRVQIQEIKKGRSIEEHLIE
jgi:Putative zinc-finger